ncbi:MULTISPECIES: histidine phosphatase family protein [Bacillus cereus group]|uniref:histidine phosphatase family protein n=1 Tax=Bacillus cereus group TaxID=86661 RepID=UPI000BF2DB1D|nr:MULTISPECIES: histidine phosphatase family protein [Bacillus cereus group]KAB5624052.1 histidine phosphatase family protein [Bacillus thuringiensis]MCU4937363.1 phosphoglycerate mutase family protein [Bacillus cereus]MCU5149604.1 phosphoglycerate mutase family protein [Bacillus cereus]MCU5458020.1 phosphoglycerate mutase family protein [Bacillus cereus]MCU5496323.1 phosphoglycerate mutase family protein [Bacillus cereus]
MKTLILVRHCKAEGQEESALLTQEGQQQAIDLMTHLLNLNFKIDKIISSPYERAVKTIKPFAEEVGLEIHTDERLSERRLSNAPITNWLDILKHTFDDIDFSVEGGESTREATERAITLIKEQMHSEKQITLMVTHGNLMTLILKHFDERFGFKEWANLTNPDIYKITIQEENSTVTRLWDTTISNSI